MPDLGQLGPLISHFPFFYLIAILIPRLRCQGVPFVICVTAELFSIIYHNCALFDGLMCLLPLVIHQMMDHVSSEAMAVTTGFVINYFKKIYVRDMTLLFSIVVLIFYKMKTDTVWYTGTVLVILFLTSFRRLAHFREYQFGAMIGVAAFAVFYTEPAEGNDLQHSFWHLLVIMSVIFLMLASFRLKCSEDCCCPIRIPMAFWDAPWSSIFLCRPWKRTQLIAPIATKYGETHYLGYTTSLGQWHRSKPDTFAVLPPK